MKKELLYDSESKNTPVSEDKEALLYVKSLYMRQYGESNVQFSKDSDYFISKTPTGYAIAGIFVYKNSQGQLQKKPFNITVNKTNGVWSLSGKYVAPDTKSGSTFLWLWILLVIGSLLFGLVMYFIMKAVIGF